MVKYSKTINGEFIDLGEEQFDYDTSLTLDETLDSCKVLVNSNLEDALPQATFILLNDEYWYLDGDKSEKNVDGTYTHTLKLVELTQILNDIFIQDCTFYQNRYTYSSGLRRLFQINELYEKRIGFEIHDSTINYNSIMPYFRFEGYSLFNALREIFQSLDRFPRVVRSDNGYLTVKFDTLDGLNRETINLDELVNNGNITLESYKERDREQNANVVVSDLYNVEAQSINFPSENLGIPLVPENYSSTLTMDNACLELPNKAAYVDAVYLYPQITINYIDAAYYKGTIELYYSNEFEDKILTFLKNTVPSDLYEEAKGFYNSFKNENHVKKSIYNNIVTRDDFYLKEKKQYDLLNYDYLFDAFTYDDKEKTIYWTQLDNKIRNFYGTEQETRYAYQFTDYFGGDPGTDTGRAEAKKLNFVVNGRLKYLRVGCSYTPSCNLKLTYENNNYDKNIINTSKKFNQTGKMIDFNASANNINNYIIRMQEEDTILNAYYIEKEDILPIGCNVIYNGNKYVVSKESITNHNNENYSVIYQLNENVIRRSEFISADSDILNYDIPINDTVERKILYKDVCYFTVNADIGNNSDRFNWVNAFDSFTVYKSKREDISYFCFKMNYNTTSTSEYDRTRYYFLPSNFIYDNKTKSCIWNCKLKDNSIIGFSNQTKYTAKSILTFGTTFSTPIRYTDDNGEIDSSEILLVENLPESTISFYPSLEYTEDSTRNILYPTTYRAKISDEDLLKDAYEVLNFTYMIQYKDSKEVKINAQDFIANNKLVYGGSHARQYYVKLSEEDLPQGLETMGGESSQINTISSIGRTTISFTLLETINIKDKNIGIYGLDTTTGNYRLFLQINKNIINQEEIQNITLYCNSYSIKA